ncbi:sterol desaturase family protein [Calothrix sp. NIES-4071]|nr:sterol desaturase family protein [Calothrix sp. NIES-4071]BAZ54948.1 sterol desaturase family protein [Calothrix sp. NIES-4105]
MEAMKAILSNMPKRFVSAIMLNGLMMTLAYFFVWKLLKTRLRNKRIQLNERADFKQIKSEFKNAIFIFQNGAFLSSLVLYLNSLGYNKIYNNFADYNVFWAIANFFIIWVIDDAWFYWMHRLLHHKSIYGYVHVVHHRSIDVTPFSSMSFHVVEGFLLSSWIFPVSFMMPLYAPALGVFKIWGLLNNIKAHLGYELYPASFNEGWLRFLTSSTHHNMHHSKFKGNYGLHFRFWDKICGTEFRDYELTFDQVQERK